MHIRFATEADSAAILDIYAQYIHTPITFETQLPTLPAFTARIRETMASYPYLVCEQNGNIVGYAYAQRQMERDAYQWNAVLSVYLSAAHTAKGLGKRLYTSLIELLKLQGICTVYGVVTLPNAPSERLHESLGFRLLGTYQKTGYKCGQWLDVAWYEKRIADCGAPRPFVPICEITTLQDVMQRSGEF